MARPANVCVTPAGFDFEREVSWGANVCFRTPAWFGDHLMSQTAELTDLTFSGGGNTRVLCVCVRTCACVCVRVCDTTCVQITNEAVSLGIPACIPRVARVVMRLYPSHEVLHPRARFCLQFVCHSEALVLRSSSGSLPWFPGPAGPQDRMSELLCFWIHSPKADTRGDAPVWDGGETRYYRLISWTL